VEDAIAWSRNSRGALRQLVCFEGFHQISSGQEAALGGPAYSDRNVKIKGRYVVIMKFARQLAQRVIFRRVDIGE
jgi:hypothetical protein